MRICLCELVNDNKKKIERKNRLAGALGETNFSKTIKNKTQQAPPSQDCHGCTNGSFVRNIM